MNKDYEDYVMYCNKHWVVAMSKETYYEMCSSYDDEMQAYMDADYEKGGVRMNYQQLGYKWLTGNFYYKHSNNLIDVYEFVDKVMWHRFQSVSYKELHESLGKIFIALIRERESE